MFILRSASPYELVISTTFPKSILRKFIRNEEEEKTQICFQIFDIIFLVLQHPVFYGHVFL